MRSLRLAVFAALVLLVSPASAQPGSDEVQIAFDGAGTSRHAYVTPFTNFTFYVAARPSQDLGGFEFNISMPPDVILLGAFAPGVPPLCVSGYCGPEDWSVPVQPCRPAGAMWLVQVQALTLTTPPDRLLCLGPSEFSSFDPPSPGYAVCASTQLVPFALGPSHLAGVPDGCAILNPSVVGADTESWGSVKARFEP